MTSWLDEDEGRAWKGLQLMQMQLTAELHRELARDAGLSLADYAVLVALSSRHEERARPYELGRELGWEKSRLSHHLARMEHRALVGREECPTDRRGAFVALTPTGRRAIERAAPGHVDAVRRNFVDLLTREQLAVVADVAATVLAHLAAKCDAAKRDEASCDAADAAAGDQTSG